MGYSYEIKDFDAGGRIGQMKLGGKILDTPNLFPVVNPFQNVISPRRLFEEFGAQCLFTNAYIIYKNRERNPEILEKKLHAHLDFPGIIATDSGGFQDYMYAGDIKLSPEEIEPFQELLGSDCPVILDIPVQTTDSYEEAKEKVEITLQRARDNITRRKRTDTAWFGPIHGSIYPDLLKLSALEMSKLDYGIYAIGGVVKTFIDYRFDLDVDILLEVRKWLRPDRPLHMFGLGLPAFFSLAVACGADTFDSAAYILYAKADRYFTFTGTKNIQKMVELPCHCPICSKYTAQELQLLGKQERIEKLAEHNLFHSFSELRTIRQAIREGTLWDLVEQRVHAHPKLLKALKRLQMNNNAVYFDQMLNLNKIKGQKYLGSYSFYRAPIARFRQKIRQFSFPEIKSGLVCVPELDLPAKNSPMLQSWIKDVRSNPDWSHIQFGIMSNLMGFIPLELAEMYPAGQHEGSGDMLENSIQRQILLDDFHHLINNNIEKLKSIKIFIPKSFVNEYSAEEPFNAEAHIIYYLQDMIRARFPSLQVIQYNSIENLTSDKTNE
jgi:7-cyano-7-deazaguanine tRNA-ribosyltransferase